jgi:hypothetical protein
MSPSENGEVFVLDDGSEVRNLCLCTTSVVLSLHQLDKVLWWKYNFWMNGFVSDADPQNIDNNEISCLPG